jgi:UDP-2-acetamido-3-amino-2,3-dideoxy-glucuronate N-acetyltransferase
LIDDPVNIGPFTQVQPFTRIMANTIIGAYVDIGQSVSIGEGVMIGNHVTILNNVVMDSGTILEDDVHCGACVVFTPKANIRALRDKLPSLIQPTIIKRGSQIGPNTTIANGVHIGKYTFIEAGSVIDQPVQDYQVVMGNPIRVLAWRCECGDLLWQEPTLPSHKSLECQSCGAVYLKGAHSHALSRLENPCHHDSHTRSHPAKRGPTTSAG